MRLQYGFTLIELIIALALGLIISAAAVLMFITGQKSYVLQQGMANLQNNTTFGLNYITDEIRSTNLNVIKSIINDETTFGGIVLTSAANARKIPTVGTKPEQILSNLYPSVTGANTVAAFLTSGGAHSSNVKCAVDIDENGCEAGDVSSDQLVIQYKPQYVTDDNKTPTNSADDKWFGGYDCEGNKIEFLKTEPTKRIVVQRYFLREDSDKGNEPNDSLSLACSAGWYWEPYKNATGIEIKPTVLSGLSGQGEIIMKRVDHLRVLFGIQTGNTYRYISITEYKALANPKPRILSVQLGLLGRSTQSVGNDSAFKADQEFKVLDQTVVVKAPSTNTSSKYIREVVSQTIALRNTFGERGK